jgi:glycosyltransferase involved in cell wall biosynthesis
MLRINDRLQRPSVLVLNRSYWPDAEATGQLLTELCEDLASRFEITVIAGQTNQNPTGIPCRTWGAQEHHGVTIRRVPHLKLGKKFLWARGLNLLTYFAGAAITALFARRPAAVVVETDPFLLPLLGRLLQARHGCRLIVYLQDIYPDVAVATGTVRNRWYIRMLRRWLFAVYRRADRVIVLGEDMRAILTESGVPDDRITTVSNWADTDRIHPVREDNAFRRSEALDGQFVVMYSGNMGLCQNLDNILEAASLLRDRSDIEFVFIGDGASRARLENRARERNLANVRFRPYQPQSQLAHSLSAADLHLVPLDARLTGCLVPSKLYGVLAAGVPSLVVADERCEASRVIRESATGKIVAPDNPQQLAETIAWCAANRGELQQMGRRARLLAERDYDRKTTTDRFGRLLDDTIAGSSSPVDRPCPAQTSQADLEPV